MLKQLIVIFTIFLSTLIFAQEKPQEQKEETQQDSLVQTSESIDTSLSGDSKELKIWNKVCPVMGNKVDVDGPTIEYNGKLYGFCCPGCDAKFKKNPEKYSKNLSEDGTKFIGRK
ncbi:MAG: YHS domain-containing protein [Ignavibacteriaceae bacterium]|jgi:YHS domain-containing protein|nr:YHS domain-containing protein [Ignavibacteriaceae bacterium]